MLGETLAEKFLMKRGYKILDKNFRRPWGELDIVARRGGKIHFVEVKSSSAQLQDRVTSNRTESRAPAARVTQETSPRKNAYLYLQSGKKKDRYRPEDNVHYNKIKRLKRIIQTYLQSKRVSDETEWQFDVATVYIDENLKRAKVNFMEGLVL